MAAAIAAASVGSFLNLGLPMLRNAVGSYLHRDVDSIKFELGHIQAVFREYSSSVATNEVMEEWLKELRLLAYDHEDFTDCFLCGVMPPDKEAAAGGGFLRRAGRFVLRKMMPGLLTDAKIRDLNKRSIDTSKRFKHYVDAIKFAASSSSSTSTATGNEAPTAPSREESMEDDAAEKSLRRLLDPAPEKKLKVISIVGFGALGNTLLVDRVCNDHRVCRQFPLRARVDVAGKDVKQVLQEILEQLLCRQLNQQQQQLLWQQQQLEQLQLGQQQQQHTRKKKRKKKKLQQQIQEIGRTSINGVDEGLVAPSHQRTANHGAPLIEGLRSHLKNTRYLIIIDNVGMSNLKKIIDPCGHDVDGRVIATTDYTEAIHCKCLSRALDSSSKAKVLKIRELTKTISEQETGMLKKELQDVLVSNYKKSLSSLDFEECLLHFCMFPHDHLVRRNLLMMRYLADGIAFAKSDKQQEGVSCSPEDCLKILIDHNIVQPIQISKNGQVKRCQPPVMMLNHISGMSKSKNFFTLFCGSTAQYGLDPDEKDHVRRLSLHPISGENAKLSLPNARDSPRLRTLAVFHTGLLANIGHISKFSEYVLLRVLDLKECADLKNKHLGQICDLLLLKYLSLGDSIDAVPRGITKLKWLQTLDMTRTKTVSVPVEVMELPLLKHLLGNFQLYEDDITKKKLKELLSKPSRLKRFSGFVVTGSSLGFPQLMSHMKLLTKVKMWCEPENGTIDDVSTAIKEFIRKDGSKSLSIDWQKCPFQVMEFLEGPGIPTSLKLHGELKPFLDSQVKRRIPKFTQLTGIVELCLSGTNLGGDEIVGVLTHFTSLIYLKLVEDKLGQLKIGSECLFDLERICLVGVQILDGIIFEDGALPFLNSLHILFRTQGDLSGIDIKKLLNLNEVALYSGVSKDKKEKWIAKALKHTNHPNVLFIQSPEFE